MKSLSLFSLLLLFALYSCNEKAIEPKIIEEIGCDAEMTNSDKSKFVSKRKFVEPNFSAGSKQSSEQAYTGKYSLKLDKNIKFGFSYTIENVKANEHYVISAWRFSKKPKGGIVASHMDSQRFYQAQKISTNKTESGWEELVLDFIIPSAIDGESIKVYAWNPDTNTVSYYDDFNIKLIENLPQK